MSIISGSLVEVNYLSGIYAPEQNYEFDPHERKALNKLRAELRAGRYHRCPKCLRWVNQKQHGAVMSHTLRTPDTHRPVKWVAFVVCKKCFAEMLLTREGPQLMVEAASTYFNGEYCEVAE